MSDSEEHKLQIEAKINEIELAMGQGDFWSDKDKAQAKVKELQADVNHATFPIGPVGTPSEVNSTLSKNPASCPAEPVASFE